MTLVEIYSKAAEIIDGNETLSVRLCEVYRIVENLPVVSRIPPVLVCMTSIDDESSKAIQRLLISISNLAYDKTNAGRTTVYTDDVFYFLALTMDLSTTLIERNQNSLTKIFECGLNHLLFLVNNKKTERFSVCCEILAALMQRIGVAKSNEKLLDSITFLIKPDPNNMKDVYYTNLQTKTIRNCGIFVLWSLNAYLMENSDVKVPLGLFIETLKLTYATNNSALQKVCVDQLGMLLKHGGPETRKLFPQICEELDYSYDHPVIVYAFNAVLRSC